MKKHLMIFLAILGVACGSKSNPNPNPNPNPTPPETFSLVSQAPEGDATDVTSSIRVVFNEALTAIPTLVSVEDISRREVVPISETRLIDNNTTVEVVLNLNRLLFDTRYRVTIRDFQSVSGRKLPTDNVTWEFATTTTRSDFKSTVRLQNKSDIVMGLATDEANHRFITGSQEVDENGTINEQVYLAMIDETGNVVWHRAFGSTKVDIGMAVKVHDGMIYVAGDTLGDIAAPNAGNQDVFMAQFNIYGVQQWAKQIGTAERETINAIAVDSSRNAQRPGPIVYAVGSRNDRFGTQGQIYVYHPQGDILDIGAVIPVAQALSNHQVGINDIAVASNGDVYVSGFTSASLRRFDAGVANATPFLHQGQVDAFWFRYRPEVTEPIDSIQMGGPGDDNATGIALLEYNDGVRLAIAGYTSQGIGVAGTQGGYDGFVAGYFPTTSTRNVILLEQIRQLGTIGDELISGIDAHPSENMYTLIGSTTGEFPGFTNTTHDEFALSARVFYQQATGQMTLIPSQRTETAEQLAHVKVAPSGASTACGGFRAPLAPREAYCVMDLYP